MSFWQEFLHTRGWMHSEEGGVLFGLALSTQAYTKAPCAIVELGTYRGRSGILLAEATKLMPGVSFVTIDNYSKDKADEAEARAHMGPRGATVIRGDSAEEGRKWRGPPVALLFIDAGHEYEEVKADADAWLPHVPEGGIVVFHDWTRPGISHVIHGLGAGWEDLGRVLGLAMFRRLDITGNDKAQALARGITEEEWNDRRRTHSE